MSLINLSSKSGLAIAALATIFAASGSAGAQVVNPDLYSGLVWRNVGPFRGGRVAAVTGVIGEPGTFYMGLPLGGVWKTTSAGTTWYPIFDSVKEASSVGAIEVAPSDPNVIYVGMGDLITGGGINEGNGVYKSTDAGKTWQHMGLDETKQIPSILVDPHDPNIVLVAAQGNVHVKSPDRGIFRSTDGGKTWTKTLFVDDQTGIQKITWAEDNPSVMLATSVAHYNDPTRARGFGGPQSTGPTGTALFKSTDEGLTWKEVKGDGLPRLSGRTCVAIAMHTNSQRMFLVGNFGLYRSDDGGDHWRHMDSADRRVMNGQGGYNCGVYVNSSNPDTVYVVNTCSYVSTDGGETFTGFKGAPGGDDPQQMWIDPTNGNRIFLGMDQGATISLDAGKTWSLWYNQSTAQVYHISVDNSFPYWIYATEQDSGSVATRSRGDLGEITPLDWLPTPAYEFGSIVADPLDPKIIYAGGEAGGIVKITYPSGQWINVSPNIDVSQRLRKVGNQPLIWSAKNPHELYAGFQYLMATTDGGKHWNKLSPDLGYAKGVKPPAQEAAPARRGSGITLEEAYQEDEDREVEGEPTMQGPPSRGGAIESISPSSVDGGVIWVGTSNGLVKLTRDHGKTWEDVSIPHLKNADRADISAVDASHFDIGTAYVAIDYHSTGDYAPSFYKTHDFGQHWTEIVKGLPSDQPSGSFSRCIRNDTKQPGLLFAGTESSMYVSFNDGDNWESLVLNLPNTSYRDIVVKNNDLVVGTYGRGFWILDDISPLRELAAASQKRVGAALSAETYGDHLFRPGDAIRVRRNVGQDTPFPPEVPHALNPPQGVVVYYSLAEKPSTDISIEFSDANGKVLRHLSSAPIPPSNDPPPPNPDFWTEIVKPLPSDMGMHRINWDLRCDSPPAFSHSFEINANPGQTPASPLGPLVPPGTYTATLVVDGKRYSQQFRVTNDPRSPATDRDVQAQFALQDKLYDGEQQAWIGYQRANELRAQIAEIQKSKPESEVADAADKLDEKLQTVGWSTSRGFGFGFGGGRGGAESAPSFATVQGALLRQSGMLDSADMRPTAVQLAACKMALDELEKTNKAWADLTAKDLVTFNAILAKHNIKQIALSQEDTSQGR